MTATFDAVRLAFDAAMLVVSYAETQPGGDDGEFGGSFKGVLKAVFVSKRGRSSLIATAWIAGAILTAVVPPVGAVTLVVVTGVDAANRLVDNVLEARLEKRVKSAELAKDQNAEAELSRLREENKTLRNDLAGLSKRVVDIEAVVNAEVTDVRIGVVPEPGQSPAAPVTDRPAGP